MPDRKPRELSYHHALALDKPIQRSRLSYPVVHGHVDDIVIALVKEPSRIIKGCLVPDEVTTSMNPDQDWRQLCFIRGFRLVKFTLRSHHIQEEAVFVLLLWIGLRWNGLGDSAKFLKRRRPPARLRLRARIANGAINHIILIFQWRRWSLETQIANGWCCKANVAKSVVIAGCLWSWDFFNSALTNLKRFEGHENGDKYQKHSKNIHSLLWLCKLNIPNQSRANSAVPQYP